MLMSFQAKMSVLVDLCMFWAILFSQQSSSTLSSAPGVPCCPHAPDQVHLWLLQGGDSCILVLTVLYPAFATLVCKRCSEKLRILDIILSGESRTLLVFKINNSQMLVPFLQENNFLSHDFLDSPPQRVGLMLECPRSSRLSIICSPFPANEL